MQISDATVKHIIFSDVFFEAEFLLERRAEGLALSSRRELERIGSGVRGGELGEVRRRPARQSVCRLSQRLARQKMLRRKPQASCYLELNPICLDHTLLRRTCSGTLLA